MRCPDCCIDVPRIPDKGHYPWEYFEQAARYLCGAFKLITLTGGEATVHPQFREFVPKLKALFKCQVLSVETNGYGFTRFPEAFDCFDVVAATIYTPDSFPGCPDNRAAIEAFRQHPNGKKLLTGKTVFVPRTNKPSGRSCAKHGILSYAYGKLFGCCVGSGIDRSYGIELDADWRQKIVAAPVPCSKCFFSV